MTSYCADKDTLPLCGLRVFTRSVSFQLCFYGSLTVDSDEPTNIECNHET